jgi:hypothetical protein
MKTRYDRLANCMGYGEGDKVWLYRPTRAKGKSPKLQSSWEAPCKIVTRINDVVYRIQRNPTWIMMLLHLDQLTSYQGTAQGERPYGRRSGSCWRIITVRREPQGRKARAITDITRPAIGKEEMVVRL